MRLPFVFALLLATRLPVAAQAAPAVSLPVVAPALAADTIAAIHRLFAAKRKMCAYVAGGTAMVAGVGAVTALSQPAPDTGGGNGFGFGAPGFDERPINALGFVVVGAAVVGLELLTLGGWGQREEARVIMAYQQHQLSRRISRRLKPVCFRP
ncbi:hypothetical protein [Hymenobacter sp. IS2118]|uniref:hypothetical protein n=1 Tax=Hymenobacter sp. IS2118 TaxID=1505605 RepID=UPI00055268BB|nr:hypothetical protein [Hymenobacter sp. IS2118]